ncbi:MAG TPA: site-specific integrase [Stellaceae bacterium]|nr:site-specific integrase [Stellaceae bacterium]
MARLTRTALKQLAIGQRISRGGIMAERTGAGVHLSVNFMVDGRRVHRHLGLGASLAECEQFIEQSRTDARRGRLNLPAGRKLPLTFVRAADDYIDRLEQSNGKNLVAKRRQLRMYLKPHFSTQRLDGLTDFAIERYKKIRRDAGAAPATVDRELATLAHLLHRAVEWKWLDRLPTRPKKFNLDQRRIVALDDTECDRLMTAARASADIDLWLCVEFGLHTAMRHREILGARWDRIDFTRRRLYIPEAKAGQREQPITKVLADVLASEREMRDDREGWIFPARRAGKSATLDRMSKPFKAAVIAAGLDPAVVTPHTLRHTAITRLVESGIDLATVQRISGHKTLTMVMRYSHVHGQHIDKAIAALERPANPVAPKLHQGRHTSSRWSRK